MSISATATAIPPDLIEIDFLRCQAACTRYQPETGIAEKFQARVALGMFNSHMKDFFDLWASARGHRRLTVQPCAGDPVLRVAKRRCLPGWAERVRIFTPERQWFGESQPG